MVRATDALHVIAAAAEGLGLPEPTEYAITTSAIRLGFRSPADVDQWARHIGLHPGCVTTASGEYAAVELARSDGVAVWCGAEAVTLAAPIPTPDRGSTRTAVSVVVLAAVVTLAVAVVLTGLDTAGWW